MATVLPPAAERSPAAELPPELRPCVDHLVTEDDTPVDNMFSEKQQRLLTEPLYNSWDPGRPYLAASNVGMFYAIRQPPLVPDAFLSLDVEVPGDWLAKEHRSYFFWEFGKPPEAVVEIVSNQEGGETTDKMLKYAQIRILYYAIYDPFQAVQSEPLSVFALRENRYEPCSAAWLPVLGLGLTLWQGRFENWETVWLRWCDRDGRVIRTGAERADEEHQRADQEHQRAEQERQRAEQEHVRAEHLAAQLRSLGVTPEER
jgi:Uma2 family endonuclease